VVGVPLTLRALVLVPLLAVAVDHARATLACGPRASSCLEAAGQGWLGGAGTVLLVLYALALAFGVGRIARGWVPGRDRVPGFLRAWLVGTAGVAAVCGGQALLAGALGDGAALGGGWPELLVFCAVAGAALALALRVVPAAAELVRDLRPAAPRLGLAAPVAFRLPAAPATRPRSPLALAAPGRGPPAPLD
jgi:hypothetical protein